MYTYDGSKWVASARQSQVTGIAFIRSTSQPATPTGGSYVSPTPTTSGWSDGIPSGTGAVWWSSRIFTSDGLSPEQDAWSTPTQAVDSQYVVYEYSISNTGPWQSVAFDGAIYARVRTNNNGTWSDWSVYRIKGETGSPGLPGADGDRGSSILSGTATLSSAMVNAFYNEFGNVVNGDQYLSSNSTTGSIIYTYNGSSFVNTTALKVDGDAIINGTLAVNKLVSGKSGISNTTGTTFGLGTVSAIKDSSGRSLSGAVIGEASGTDSTNNGYHGVLGHSSHRSGVVAGTFSTTGSGALEAYCGNGNSYTSVLTSCKLATNSHAIEAGGNAIISGSLKVKENHVVRVVSFSNGVLDLVGD
jgi:hypothetical protein